MTRTTTKYDSEKTLIFSQDSLRFRTDKMERSLDTLQANETLLRNTIDDLTSERQQAMKETASWKARFTVRLFIDFGIILADLYLL